MATRQTPLKLTKNGYITQKGTLGKSTKYYLGYELAKAENRRFLIDRLYSIQAPKKLKLADMSMEELSGSDQSRAYDNSFEERRINYCRQIAKYGQIVELADMPFGSSCSLLEQLKKLELVKQESTRGASAVTQTKLHLAIDAYEAWRKKEYVGKAVGVERVTTQIKEIKSSIKDVFLSECTHDFNQSFINEYRKRKKTQKGTIATRDWSSNQIGEYVAMCKWIARNYKDYPQQTFEFETVVQTLSSDSTKNEVKEIYYSVDELKTIYRASNEDVRLMIALGLNTCGSSAEIGRYKVSDFILGDLHPRAKTIKMETKADYLYTTREKTKSHTSHILWGWVGELVRERIELCKANKWVYLFSDDEGNPRYKDAEMYQELGLQIPVTKKPEKYFYDQFDNVVKKLPLTKKLSFSYLRKHFPNYLATEVGEEALASLALSHSVSADKLLHHYANKPFKKLFQATIDSEKYWDLTTI